MVAPTLCRVAAIDANAPPTHAFMLLKTWTIIVPHWVAFCTITSQFLYSKTPIATTAAIAATTAKTGKFKAAIAPAKVNVPVALAAVTAW